MHSPLNVKICRITSKQELLHASNYIKKTLLVLDLEIHKSDSQHYESSATRQPDEVPSMQVY